MCVVFSKSYRDLVKFCGSRHCLAKPPNKAGTVALDSTQFHDGECALISAPDRTVLVWAIVSCS